MKLIRSIGTILKSPEKLFKAEHDLYGFASVEVPDRDGDMIRIGGIKLTKHAESSVKLVGTAHKYSPLADGTFPQVGTIKEFARTSRLVKGQQVPALAFAADYVKDEKGEVDSYAKKFKVRYDNGDLDSFSSGFDDLEVKPLAKGRYDVVSSDIFEISCCLIPTNPYTTILKALKEDFGDDIDASVYLDERLSQIASLIKSAVPANIEDQAPLLKSLSEIIERLDNFEDSLVTLAKAAKSQSDPRASQPDPYAGLREQLNKALAKLPAPK